MFVFSFFFEAVANVLNIALTIYMWILIIRALISWVNPDPYNAIVRFLRSVTDPVLYRVRRILPVTFGGFDFAPVILILAIVFLQSFVVKTLLQFARELA